MTPPLRLLFDDCLSKHAVIALKTLASYSDGLVEFMHLVDYALSGQLDDDWIPKIKDMGLIVVSTDRGKKNHGGKLPLICQRNFVTYIVLSAAIHKRNTFDKIRALFGVWPDLLVASTGQAGCGYLLHGTDGSDQVKLKCVYKPPDDSLPPPPGQLFAT